MGVCRTGSGWGSNSLADVVPDSGQGPGYDVDVRVSLVGIEILTRDARIVVASVDTYLRSPGPPTGSTSTKRAARTGPVSPRGSPGRCQGPGGPAVDGPGFRR